MKTSDRIEFELMNSIWNLVKISQSNTYSNVIVCGFWVKLDITSLHRKFFKHLFWVRRKFLSISFFFFSFGHPLEYVTSLSKCLLLVFVSICFCDHVPHCKRIERRHFLQIYANEWCLRITVQCRTNIKKFSIHFQGPRIWNSLPNDMPRLSVYSSV